MTEQKRKQLSDSIQKVLEDQNRRLEATGGFAFPDHQDSTQQCMTLLDWFAGQAIASSTQALRDSWTDTAYAAYTCAEAMLAEKRKREANA